jgi:tRNA-modifying protein YgfZ
MIPYVSFLPDRSVLRISGIDAYKLLQGIITNNVMLLETQPAIFSALLTPQGKFLYDFFLVRDGESILLETEHRQITGLMQKLTMYRLRAAVHFELLPHAKVYAAADAMHLPQGGICYADPRHPALWTRCIDMKATDIAASSSDAYHAHRLSIGIPEGWHDLVAERSLLIEHGYDLLHAVDFRKGCYVGQEVTARSKYRGVVRKTLYHVYADSLLPSAGTVIWQGEDHRDIGEMRSSVAGVGLALLRIEDVQPNTGYIAGDAVNLTVRPLAWNQRSE